MYLTISLIIERLVCSQQQHALFRPISFTLGNGEILLVHGVNGVGKTTCLRTLAGLLTPTRGKIYWQQQLLKPYYQEYLAQMIYIGHHPGIKLALTAEENIQQSLALAGHSCTNNEIRQALTRVGLARVAQIPCSHLSSGQQRRVNAARLILMQVPLWILDEPLTALDKQGVQLMHEIFAEHQLQGGSVILTSHLHLTLANSTVELEPAH